jgi:hypothetical protein
MWALLLGVGLGIALMPGVASASWWRCCTWPECLKCNQDEKCEWYRYLPCWPAPEHSHERAGYGGKLSCITQPTDTPAYVGYYVGGGAVCCGEPRCLDEGTWGWDYQGCLLPRRIILQWWHGRHYQGGSGQYQPDGPISPCSKPAHHGH